jgi:CheY-like chemotaxis protein/HPt (histidine-containing phosphotransfer) domain-containing protein
MDFKTKLAFALVAASLISMSALGAFTYLWAADSFVEDSKRQLAAFAEERGEDVDTLVERWRTDVERIADRAQPVASVPIDETEVETPGEGEVKPVANAIEAVAAVLRLEAERNDEIKALRLVQIEPELQSPVDADGSNSKGDTDASRATFVGSEIDAGGWGVVFHAPLSGEGEAIGRLEAVFDAGALDKLFGAVPDIGESAQALLVVQDGANRSATDREEYFLVGSEEPPTPSKMSRDSSPSISAALSGEDRMLVDIHDAAGREMLAATRFIAETDWGIVVQIEADEARRRADQLLSNMSTLGISLAAFAILGGTLFGFYLAAPINRLVRDVDRIRHGELGLRLEVKGEDEAAFLARSLNEFMDQLDRSSDLFRLGELNVLVICDDRKERELLRDLLQNWNMRPTLADNGASALSAFEQASRENAAPQLVLLDESLSEAERNRFVTQLPRAGSARIPFILLSSDPDALDPKALRAAGIGQTLPKPIVASHLMEAILDEMGVSADSMGATTDVFLKKTVPRKVLLAEDNALIQRVMVEFLANWGHSVTLADDGREALLRIQSERFDLILMDVEMPVMNGLEATAAIREYESGRGEWRTPIVALTAEAMSGDRDRCLAAGMDDYISKPADPKALYALIKRYPARVLTTPEEAVTSSAAPRSADASSNDAPRAIVDWEAARGFTNDNASLLRDLVTTFPADARQQVEAIRLGIKDDDLDVVTRSAHTLKGSALILGAERVAHVALSIEKLGRSGASHACRDAEPLVEELDGEVDRLIDAFDDAPFSLDVRGDS